MAYTFKKTMAVALILVTVLSMLAGCGGPKALKLEPFELKWGMNMEEAGEQLKCVYRTNERASDTIYVLNGDNDNGLQAFGTTPSMIIYTFDLVKSGSDIPLLGDITVCFPEEDYDKVHAYLEKKCGKQYFEDPQWGMAVTDVYLFSNGLLTIKYSSDPIVDPAKVSAETRDRYVALSGILFASERDNAGYKKEQFGLLSMYSTAETDFVKVDNSK